jgi:TrwC relaxase
VGPTRTGYADVKGIGRPVIEHFSRRRAEITEALALRGVSSAKAAEVAAYRTRQGKDYGVDPDRRRAEWAARAQEFDLDREGIEELGGRVRAPTPLGEAEIARALLLGYAPTRIRTWDLLLRRESLYPTELSGPTESLGLSSARTPSCRWGSWATALASVATG